MKNLKLKVAIVTANKTQKEVADNTGLSGWLLSRIVNGRVNPTETEKEKIAAAIDRPICEIFPEQ